ncbi:MAG: hypothetical protein OEZ02_15400 [Anaerolineae bacterium]|nr:hypothetical protein [Anaerolineae bacterium]
MHSKDVELSVWCPQCKTDGLLTIPEAMLDEPHYVLCPACGGETAQVWCATCGMGGQLFDNVAERPDAWRCGECKSEYPLPADFYDKPVEFVVLPASDLINKLGKTLIIAISAIVILSMIFSSLASFF